MDLITLAVAKKYTDKAIAQAAVGDIDVESYVKDAVDEVIGGASGTFDTLGEIETAINNKVDKISGKGLSTNDFTNAYKTKLDSALTSYIETDPTVPAWAKEPNKPKYTASDVGAVPTTRTINGKVLSDNISLNASDIGALPNTTTLFSGNYNDLTNKPTIPSVDGLATTTYVDNAVANKEFILNSITEGSTKKFRVTVDDSGILTAVEVTE